MKQQDYGFLLKQATIYMILSANKDEQRKMSTFSKQQY